MFDGIDGVMEITSFFSNEMFPASSSLMRLVASDRAFSKYLHL